MSTSATSAVTVAKPVEKKHKSNAHCVTGFYCGACKPDYHMALAMCTHRRLGEASPLANLTDDLLHNIIKSTMPKRKLPEWMSCTWKARKAKKT
jgi:hypothetical protein